MTRGIFYTFLACFIWGAIFVIPGFMTGFHSFEVALGRYLFYGLAALFALSLGRFELLSRVETALWIKAFWLGLAGNILYYFALVVCMRDAGAAISALMLGLGPITIAWYGNWQSKESHFKGLILPSIATLVGLICVNVPAFENNAFEGTLWQYIIGLLAGFLAIGLWTWYAISSKMVLMRHTHISARDWSTILGLSTFVSVLVILAAGSIAFWGTPSLARYWHWTPQLQTFLLGTAFLGIPCSWLGFYLWSKGSTLIPVALSGQLLIFETLFGLCFVYLLEERLPLLIEWVGMTIMLAGILAAMLQTKQEQIQHQKANPV